jgi:rubrerythrin
MPGLLSDAGINNQCDTITERMGLVETFRGVVGTRTSSPSTLYECRHCGTTLSEDAETCPTCGGDDVVCYQF